MLLAFTVMVAVSIATRCRTPADVGATMLRLYAPRDAATVTARRWGQGGQLLRSWNECG